MAARSSRTTWCRWSARAIASARSGSRPTGLHKIDRLVICAGAYSHLLARQLGEKILLEAERGYHMVLPNSGISLSRSLTYARTPGAATPMEMGLRLAGTDEFAGLDAAPDYRRADALWKHFKAVLPGLREPDAADHALDGQAPGNARTRFPSSARPRPRPTSGTASATATWASPGGPARAG